MSSLPIYRDPNASPLDRARDLLSRMTLDEKAHSLNSSTAPIERLGLPQTRLGSECIHGLAGYRATVFPQSLNLSASWNVDLVSRVAGATSREAMAMHELCRNQRHGPGRACWSPNINIFRDPRWGRGQETYGEDPYLTGRLGVAFINAMQGSDPLRPRMGCVVKHYAVHSGPDAERHKIDVRVSAKDLWETYLPHFAAAVREGKAMGVMAAYNRVNGEPAVASPTLLGDILRRQWGFEGFVISDGGGLHDLHDGHGVTRDDAESAAYAVTHGCDICLGVEFKQMPDALKRGLVTEADLDAALMHVLPARFALGLMDDPEPVPAPEVIDCDEHRALALEAARESIVLLRNKDNLLPLRNPAAITVVGPTAAAAEVMLGNYNGWNGRIVTPLEGIVAGAPLGTRLHYVRGCDPTGDNRDMFTMALRYAARSEVVVAVMGLTPMVEGEEHDAPLSDWIGDRLNLDLPPAQQALLEALAACGKPVVLVLTGCAPMAVAWAMEHLAAVVHLGYPGEEGGTALADVLFGRTCPSGRLTVTWPKSTWQLPPFHDYSMAGRTYRYMTAEPLAPFGYGLSYTNFEYSDLRLSANDLAAGQTLEVSVQLANTGQRDGDEVVQVYLSDLEASAPVPLRQLVGFAKVHLARGERRRVSFTITPRQMALIDLEGKCVLEPGLFAVTVGSHQGDSVSVRLTGSDVLRGEFAVAGKPLAVPY